MLEISRQAVGADVVSDKKRVSWALQLC